MSIFSKVKMSVPDQSTFNLTHDVKLSMKMGVLTPSMLMECLPGDKVRIKPTSMLRFAPLISPVMHRINVVTDFYFVPNRILWPTWERFITKESDAEAPYIDLDGLSVGIGSLADYLGIPTGAYTTGIRINAMPFAAYLKIWDEFYRDQNLQDEQFIQLAPGDNTAAFSVWLSASPLRRAWMHDYFTSCLPFAQKGDSVQLPLTQQSDIPVEWVPNSSGSSGWLNPDGTPASEGDIYNVTGPVPFLRSTGIAGLTDKITYDPRGSLEVDVQSNAVDINTFRWAMALQKWLEKNARGGTRYIESILSHFGVRSSDARLQRPEFIGRQSGKMVISEVLATAENTTANVPVGQMAGHGISFDSGDMFQYLTEEHGFIIGLINVQPVTAYQQGLHRMWSRETYLDYAFPTFANLGEQEVKNKEVKAITALDPDGTFGYLPRYAEYKNLPNRVAGEMRSSLDFWHLGRIFSDDPVLNEEFIACEPSTRIFAVTDPDEDHIFAHIMNEVYATRKLPYFGTPL